MQFMIYLIIFLQMLETKPSNIESQEQNNKEHNFSIIIFDTIEF